MGIGFVLLIWMVLCGLAAVPISAAVAYWSWRNSRDTSVLNARRSMRAALLPFLLIVVGLVWFIAYGVYCEVVRGVDPGIGDMAMVPIVNGYSLCMMDVPAQAYVMKGGCGGVALVDGIRQLGIAGDLVVGASSESPGFVLDTRTGAVSRFPDSAAALAQAPAAAPLHPSNEFYSARRYGWQDVAAGAALLAALAVVVALWYRRFIRAPALT